MIMGVAGIIIWTSDLKRLLPFYQNSLGLKPNSVHSDFVSFKWGDKVRLGIGVHSKVSGQSKEPHRVMVNLEVDNIHEVHHHLSSNGVEFIRVPQKEHWGGWICTLSDPDGNIIQLMQLRS